MREKAETPSPNSNCCRKPLSHLAVGSETQTLAVFRVGSADMRFPGDSGKPENSGT